MELCDNIMQLHNMVFWHLLVHTPKQNKYKLHSTKTSPHGIPFLASVIKLYLLTTIFVTIIIDAIWHNEYRDGGSCYFNYAAFRRRYYLFCDFVLNLGHRGGDSAICIRYGKTWNTKSGKAEKSLHLYINYL